MKLSYEKLTRPGKDGLIPSLEICKISHPLPFEDIPDFDWRYELIADDELEIHAYETDFTFQINMRNGDLFVFFLGNPRCSVNLKLIIDKYIEMGFEI